MVLKMIAQPIWFCRVFEAVILVLFGQPGNLLLVTVCPKQLICFLLVECAAHTTVCGVHWEYGWATHSLTFPNAPLDHSWNVLQNSLVWVTNWYLITYHNHPSVTWYSAHQSKVAVSTKGAQIETCSFLPSPSFDRCFWYQNKNVINFFKN